MFAAWSVSAGPVPRCIKWGSPGCSTSASRNNSLPAPTSGWPARCRVQSSNKESKWGKRERIGEAPAKVQNGCFNGYVGNSKKRKRAFGPPEARFCAVGRWAYPRARSSSTIIIVPSTMRVSSPSSKSAFLSRVKARLTRSGFLVRVATRVPSGRVMLYLGLRK